MEIKYKVWLETDGKVVFGHGRERLFLAIEECRSLNAAAKKLGMSYRAAWGRLRASEERLGINLVETSPHEKGMHLTVEGKRLLDSYMRLEQEINDYAAERGRDLFKELNIKPEEAVPEGETRPARGRKASARKPCTSSP